MSRRKPASKPQNAPPVDDFIAAAKPDYERACKNCGARPIVPATGLCGPCTFGEAETAGGNW